MEVRLDIRLDQLGPSLTAARAAAEDWSPAMRAVARLMEAATDQRFEDGRSPDGAAWQPSRRAREEGGQTLVDRGLLRRSISSSSTATEAVVGTNLVYAAIHQFGGDIRPRSSRALRTPFGPRSRVRMPARPFIGFSDDDRRGILQLLADHLSRAFPKGAA